MEEGKTGRNKERERERGRERGEKEERAMARDGARSLKGPLVPLRSNR